MKTLILILIVTLGLNAIHSPAQVYNVLHNFGSPSRDGYAPLTGLVLSSNTLWHDCQRRHEWQRNNFQNQHRWHRVWHPP